MADLLSFKTTGSAVKPKKIKDMKSARDRIVSALEKQMGYWKAYSVNEDYSDIRYAGKEGKRSLWFKKMDLTNDYMLKISLSNISIYASDKAREKGENWFYDIPKSEMATTMEDTKKSIEAGNWDSIIQPALDELLKNLKKMAEKREEKRNS